MSLNVLKLHVGLLRPYVTKYGYIYIRLYLVSSISLSTHICIDINIYIRRCAHTCIHYIYIYIKKCDLFLSTINTCLSISLHVHTYQRLYIQINWSLWCILEFMGHLSVTISDMDISSFVLDPGKVQRSWVSSYSCPQWLSSFGCTDYD